METDVGLSSARETRLAVDGKRIRFCFDKKKKSPVLNGVNIGVTRGIIYSLLGPSGCGKTTLLKCILGQHKLQEGFLKIFGKLPGSEGVFIPGRGVGYMPQDVSLYLEMTTEETLTYFGSLYLMSQQEISERIAFLIELLELPDKKRQIEHLSGGQRRRVSLAVALVHKPPLLILDEPTVGVDPLLRQAIWDHLHVLAREEQLTIIITTHYIEEARQADVVGLMRDGHILTERNPEDLIQQYGVVTLEDVFLKFCQNNHNENEDHTACCNSQTSRTSVESPSTNCSEQNDTLPLPKDANVLFQDNNSHDRGEETIVLNSVKSYHPFEVGGPRINEAFDGSCDVQDNNQTALSLPASPNYVGIKFNKTASPFKESMMRMNCLTKKNCLRFKRNIPFILLQMLLPAIQVGIAFLGVGGEPFNLPVAVANMETNPNGYGKMFLHSVNNQTIYQKQFDNISLALESVKNGESWTAIHIGPKFTRCVIRRYASGQRVDNDTLECSKIRLFMDMSNQQIFGTIYHTLFRGLKEFSSDLLEKFGQNPSLADSPLVVEEPVYGTPTTPFHEFIAPGFVFGITFLMANGLTAIILILEKKQGLLDRTFVAGATQAEVLLSLFLVTIMTMVVQVILVFVCTFFVFNISCSGSYAWPFISALIIGIGGMAFGIFVSSICNDPAAATIISIGVFFVYLNISGTLWPLEAMPYYLRYLSYSLPLTLPVYSMRGICSRGWSITEHHMWAGYLVPISWTIVFMVLALYLFKIKK